jgi:hypothetical protein
MRKFFATTRVAACGLITSVLTAIAVLIVQKLVGLNLFTVMVWLIVPAGAIATGMVAASGYYFGSLYFHTRPGALLVMQMVVIACLTQWLIYYMEYLTLILDDGRRVSDYIDFGHYLDFILTKAQYRVGRAQTKTPEMGEAGYWIALLQLGGFLVGGLCTFLFLQDKPVCPTCKKYFRPLASTAKQFSNQEDFATYYDGIYRIPLDTPLFEDAIRTKTKKEKVIAGTISHTMSLVGCPECKSQVIIENVQVFNGSDWRDVRELHRRTLMPEGTNLAPLLRRK